MVAPITSGFELLYVIPTALSLEDAKEAVQMIAGSSLYGKKVALLLIDEGMNALIRHRDKLTIPLDSLKEIGLTAMFVHQSSSTAPTIPTEFETHRLSHSEQRTLLQNSRHIVNLSCCI